MATPARPSTAKSQLDAAKAAAARTARPASNALTVAPRTVPQRPAVPFAQTIGGLFPGIRNAVMPAMPAIQRELAARTAVPSPLPGLSSLGGAVLGRLMGGRQPMDTGMPGFGGDPRFPGPIQRPQNPDFGQYGFDPAFVDYLNRQRELSATDAGVSYQYDPATQTFTGRTMGGPVTKTLAQLQAEASRNTGMPQFPDGMARPAVAPLGQQGRSIFSALASTPRAQSAPRMFDVSSASAPPGMGVAGGPAPQVFPPPGMGGFLGQIPSGLGNLVGQPNNVFGLLGAGQTLGARQFATQPPQQGDYSAYMRDFLEKSRINDMTPGAPAIFPINIRGFQQTYPRGSSQLGATNSPFGAAPNLTGQTGGIQQAADMTAARQMLQQVNNAGQQLGQNYMQGPGTFGNVPMGGMQTYNPGMMGPQNVGQQGPAPQPTQFGSFGTFGGVFNNQQQPAQQNGTQNVGQSSGPVTGGGLF